MDEQFDGFLSWHQHPHDYEILHEFVTHNTKDTTMMSHRETEKYTKGFIVKCINVIIESRLGESVSRKCSPTKNDWFNIALNDNEHVTKECLETLDDIHFVDPKCPESQKVDTGFNIDTQWRIVCEISLQKNGGDKLCSLEYWMFENNPYNAQENTSPGASSPSSASPSSPGGSPLMNSRNPNSFASVHQKMGLMIKSLMSLTRGSPSFKLSCATSTDDSLVIFYRVCQCDPDFNNFLRSINPDIPEVHAQFTPEIHLGSICTNYNTIDISYSQRLNFENCTQPPMPRADGDSALFKEDHFGAARRQESPDDRNSPCFVNNVRREPRLAFGSDSPTVTNFPEFPPLPKNFPGISDDEDDDINALIDGDINKRKSQNNDASTKDQNSDTSYLPSSSEEKDRCESSEDGTKPPNVSQPIGIPSDRRNPNYHEHRHADSSPLGSAESYVFIDNNKSPFAPDHDDISIFFNGPTPSFVANPTSRLGTLSQIKETIAAVKSEMEGIDDFLESLNVKAGEDDEEDLLKSSSSSSQPF
ncbi:uncharacterized protein LOC107359192 isoform X2 [Tetranychus urticae]|nr:uncharacterized protein LOC107359192 isoform X2 [Tetranychus urticae]